MLLMSLDAGTAAELLKGVNPELVEELAVELAYLDAAGYRSGKQSTQIARQFCNSLQANEGFHLKSFLKEMLKNTVGDEKAEHIQTQVQNLLQIRDPFTRIRFLDSRTIASVLQKEHPRAAAAVLSELPAKKSSDVLGLLGEGVRLSVISRMTTCENMAAEAKTRMAETVCEHLEAIKAGGASEALPTRLERFLRKVAVILRNLGKELRDRLLGAIQGKDDKAGEMVPAPVSPAQVSQAQVPDLMIVWEDIPQVGDKLLQKALRGVDTKKLALALVKADYTLVQKIASNISERAAAALDEEVSCLSAPKKKDVEEAREEIVQVLREMNERDQVSNVDR